MAQNQDALMCKVQELTELVAAQSADSCLVIVGRDGVPIRENDKEIHEAG